MVGAQKKKTHPKKRKKMLRFEILWSTYRISKSTGPNNVLSRKNNAFSRSIYFNEFLFVYITNTKT